MPGQQRPSIPAKRQSESAFMYMQKQHSNRYGGGFEDAKVTEPLSIIRTLFKAILATALFRCWHILLFFATWATAVSLINHNGIKFTFQPTLLTVIGTVLGFVVSYRTTSSFERYNEGRRYWSQIILSSRTLARAVWFHIPDLPPAPEGNKLSDDERRARLLLEKKTVINLIEAFSVAVKHYLRGEEGINYVDLYHLVKYLPSYCFPAGIVPAAESTASVNNIQRAVSRRLRYAQSTRHRRVESDGKMSILSEDIIENGDEKEEEKMDTNEPKGLSSATSLSVTVDGPSPLPSPQLQPPPQSFSQQSVPSSIPAVQSRPSRTSFNLPPPVTAPNRQQSVRLGPTSSFRRTLSRHVSSTRPPPSYGFADDEEVKLQPASMPPKFALFDIFPLSLLVKWLSQDGVELEGKTAAKYRAKSIIVQRNVPLEISMYLTSYISALQQRKSIDVPTTNLLILSVTQLTDALTGLERILTTPIPFSYSMHLWVVVIIYCMALPLQIWSTLKWVTIPATTILAFIFFGFLVAGEEIENPFGYDKNDLNMDHFTQNIIRNELHALTAFPPPAPEEWCFSSRNDSLFYMGDGDPRENGEERVTPDEWLMRGIGSMKQALAAY